MCSGEIDLTESTFCGILFCSNSFTTITLHEPQTHESIYYISIFELLKWSQRAKHTFLHYSLEVDMTSELGIFLILCLLFIHPKTF